MKKPFKWYIYLKRTLVLIFIMWLVFYGINKIRNMFHKNTSIMAVNEISTIPKNDYFKEVPKQYNGQSRKIAYLTFDDGPGVYTSQLLDILKKNQVKATFFLLGTNAHKYPDDVKREKSEGHYIGMHGMTHDYRQLYKEGKFVQEMEQNQKIIKELTGIQAHLVRPPYGSMPGLNQALRDQTAAAHFKVWDWNIDSLDWKYNHSPLSQSVPAIVNTIVSQANENREVILLHDIHQQSVEAVSSIIEKLREKGYDFEAYDEQEHFNLNFWNDSRL
ncbi:polysaccharide deacetylase (plasmid) [Bacillus cereus]|uniref:polysaccharide deacetylase family protein n=1 Tax=Bacillus cereus group TaxID=86661 RepID=UPI0005A36A15|nr:polysaccharide deacetylase family protein [Bacillus cereus]AJH60280.1 polysaccharide deacetylase family protein [Bacillus cereus]AJK37344.1 polysaccharide deacetylase family protein [Bacillus cereus]QKH69351.1 polysaccharide deacetylase [Bacillus cereus]QKH71448.1 polysaccharide deacetylase [Bacillus cereus]